jgi:hypothetical protein
MENHEVCVLIILIFCIAMILTSQTPFEVVLFTIIGIIGIAGIGVIRALFES